MAKYKRDDGYTESVVGLLSLKKRPNSVTGQLIMSLAMYLGLMKIPTVYCVNTFPKELT